MKRALLVLGLYGCTDASCANVTTLGAPGTVKCFSGGQVIYEGQSTGKISTTTNSDGWEFVDNATGKFVRVSGDCVVKN